MANTAALARNRYNNEQREEQRVFCYEARIRGFSIRAIAGLASQHFGHPISKSKVEKLLTEETDSRVLPARNHFIIWEIDRLERLLTLLQPRMEQGDYNAINSAIKISDRLSTMLGLNAPVKADLQLTGDITHTTEQEQRLQRLLAEADAHAAAQEAAIKHRA